MLEKFGERMREMAANSEFGQLEQRITRLENQLARTNGVLSDLVHLLERRLGEDLDGDGRIG